jgi:hypothetical protein
MRRVLTIAVYKDIIHIEKVARRIVVRPDLIVLLVAAAFAIAIAASMVPTDTKYVGKVQLKCDRYKVEHTLGGSTRFENLNCH